MRKIVLLMHVSLDGYVAGPNGEMDWITLDSSLFDYVNTITNEADTALYGGVTYKMMESYWPIAGDKPHATKHDIEHATWVNNATKLVFSKTLSSTNWQNTRIVRDNIEQEVRDLKQQPGKNLLMLGSPSLAHSFMHLGLIDEFRLNVNPIILGRGKPLFADIDSMVPLELQAAKTFPGGVVALHYDKKA